VYTNADCTLEAAGEEKDVRDDHRNCQRLVDYPSTWGDAYQLLGRVSSLFFPDLGAN
jgi:hypothetical protein